MSERNIIIYEENTVSECSGMVMFVRERIRRRISTRSQIYKSAVGGEAPRQLWKDAVKSNISHWGLKQDVHVRVR